MVQGIETGGKTPVVFPWYGVMFKIQRNSYFGMCGNK